MYQLRMRHLIGDGPTLCYEILAMREIMRPRVENASKRMTAFARLMTFFFEVTRSLASCARRSVALRVSGHRMRVPVLPLFEIICTRMLAAQPVLSHALLGQLLAPRSFLHSQFVVALSPGAAGEQRDFGKLCAQKPY